MRKHLGSPFFTKHYHHKMFLRQNHAGLKILDCCVLLITYICPSEVFCNFCNHKILSCYSDADLQWKNPSYILVNMTKHTFDLLYYIQALLHEVLLLSAHFQIPALMLPLLMHTTSSAVQQSHLVTN